MQRTKLHLNRVIEQLTWNLLGQMEMDIIGNAKVHRYAAVNRTATVKKIREDIVACATTYLKWLHCVDDHIDGTADDADYILALENEGYDVVELQLVVDIMMQLTNDLLGASKGTYAGIINALDTVLSYKDQLDINNMTAPFTKLHVKNKLRLIQNTIVNTQKQIKADAETYKAMAVAMSPSVQKIQTEIDVSIALYINIFQDLTDFRSDPIRKQKLLDAMTAQGWDETDLLNPFIALKQAIQDLQSAPKTSYPEIITACDAVLGAVTSPDSAYLE